MRAIRFCATFVSLGLSLTLLTGPSSADELPPEKWAPWIEFGGYYGSGDSSRGEAVLWVPFAQGANSLLFGEARGKLFEEDDMREGNFALGYRQMMPGGWNLGVWGGYDIRESEYGNTFGQLAGGIEALSANWDFRANAYLPLDDSENVFDATSSITSGPTLEFTGSQIGLVTTVQSMTSRMDELALWGFDAEIGTKLFSTPEDLPGTRHELRVYAGAFHFDHSDLAKAVTGPKLRAEWRVDEVLEGWDGSRLTFEGEYSHDDLRDDRAEIGARLRLPFGGGDAGTRYASSRSLSSQERRMTEGLERDTDIVTDTKATGTTSSTTTREGVEDAATNVDFDRVATVDGTGDLTTVSGTAGANSLIIADGSNGDLNGPHVLQGDQTLMGGGSTIQVRGVTSGIVVDFTAPGSRPTLTTAAGPNTVLTLGGSNTHVSGIGIVGSTGNGILADGRSNTVVQNVSIQGGRDGIHIQGAGGSMRIIDVTIAGQGDDGIEVSGSGQTVSVIDSAISDSSYGIFVFGANNTADISGTTFSDIVFHALLLSGSGHDVTLNDSTFSGALVRGLSIVASAVALNGTGNTAQNATFSSGLCSGSGNDWSGSVEFDGTVYTNTNC